METRHIKLDYEEALHAKKQILSTELNLLQTSKKIRNYKVLRKKELLLKSKLKINLKSLQEKIKFIISTFPKEEIPKLPKIRAKKIEKKENQNIQNQLQEIKNKLARLG